MAETQAQTALLMPRAHGKSWLQSRLIDYVGNNIALHSEFPIVSFASSVNDFERMRAQVADQINAAVGIPVEQARRLFSLSRPTVTEQRLRGREWSVTVMDEAADCRPAQKNRTATLVDIVEG